MPSVTEQAYKTLSSYVRRQNGTFDANRIRKSLTKVKGLRSTQLGAVVNRAVRNNLIVRVGTTTSNNPTHKGGQVGIYVRGFSN